MKENKEPNPNDLEKLNKILRSLQVRYGRGKELHLVWEPQTKIKYNVTKGQTTLVGEVESNTRTIFIYAESYEEALPILVHEFLEYVFDIHLVRPFVHAYNEMRESLERVISMEQYHSKEALIDILVENEVRRIKREEEKYGEK